MWLWASFRVCAEESAPREELAGSLVCRLASSRSAPAIGAPTPGPLPLRHLWRVLCARTSSVPLCSVLDAACGCRLRGPSCLASVWPQLFGLALHGLRPPGPAAAAPALSVLWPRAAGPAVVVPKVRGGGARRPAPHGPQICSGSTRRAGACAANTPPAAVYCEQTFFFLFLFFFFCFLSFFLSFFVIDRKWVHVTLVSSTASAVTCDRSAMAEPAAKRPKVADAANALQTYVRRRNMIPVTIMNSFSLFYL